MNNLRNGLRALAYTLLASAIPSGLAYAGDRHDNRGPSHSLSAAQALYSGC